MIQGYINLSSLANEHTLRSDVSFVFNDLFTSSEDYYTFSDLFSFVKNDSVEVSSLSELEYVEISNVSSTEDVQPVILNYEDRNEINEKYFKKIEQGDIIRVQRGDILISKVRPYLKKFLLIDETNDSFFYTSAFIHIRPKAHSKVLFYALKNIFNSTLNSITRQGKGYPTLNEKDLCLLKFSKKYIDLLIQNNELLEQRISSIERDILNQKQCIKSDEIIINQVFIKAFNLDLKELSRLDQLKILSVDFCDFSKGSTELRDSVRFTKMRMIQQEMITHFNDYIVLDECLIYPKTKNGWSPENSELDGETKILGIDSLHFNGMLTIDNPKFTNETRDDIENFYINEGDFFVSRGNTVNLVALASIAPEIDEDILYPDIMIKLYIDERKIDKEYLAFLFNSIIGRLYFKYASRGKQQTMVKVSSETIRNFIIPRVPLKKQRELVEDIKTITNAQIAIKQKIKSLRKEIDIIMEELLQ